MKIYLADTYVGVYCAERPVSAADRPGGRTIKLCCLLTLPARTEFFLRIYPPVYRTSHRKGSLPELSVAHSSLRIVRCEIENPAEE